jgi:hypothetical protein
MKLVGARRCRAVLLTKQRGAQRGTRVGVTEWGQRAAEIMRGLAPRRSGALRRAIQVDSVDRVPSGWAAFVGPGSRVRYAAFVEYGTHDTPEQPYARPTNALAARIGPDVVSRAVRREL